MEVWVLVFQDVAYNEPNGSYVVSVCSSREKAIEAMNQYNKSIDGGTLEEEDKGRYGVSYWCDMGRYDINYFVVDYMPKEW